MNEIITILPILIVITIGIALIIAPPILCAKMAENQGRNVPFWVIFGILLSWVAVFALWVAGFGEP